VSDFIKHVSQNTAFDEGELTGITSPFHTWFSEIKVPKQGTIMKSFFLFQLPIHQERVAKLIQDHGFKSAGMIRKDWIVLGTALGHENVPHSWYIIREEYLRY
jgi:hypothetical protein